MKVTLFIPTLNEISGLKNIMPRIKKEWVDEFCISNKLFQYQPLLYAIKGHQKTILYELDNHGEVFFDFLPNSKNNVIITTRKNFDIKFALLLNILDAQSRKGKVDKVFLIISLSTSTSYSCNLLITKSINNKTLEL